MLLAVIFLKALVEIALFALIAQGILWVFAGATRDRNVVYRIFATITRPIIRGTRAITPRFIVDAHVGLVSFFVLSVLWLALVIAKIHFYLELQGSGT